MSADERDVEGDLEGDVEAELEGLRLRLANETDTHSSMAADQPAAAAFTAGFADRVMERLHQSPATPSLGEGMQVVFRRLAPLAAAAVLCVAAFNLVDTRTADLSVTERVLGLPAVTVASALTVDDDLSVWGP